MPLYRISPDKLEPVSRTTFEAESLLERKDLQRLLRRDIGVIGENLLVVAEEFGEWDDSNRRIDLLCLARDGALVVVEIKRTGDGGHMELQAIRYAAMVSGMTLDQVVHAHARAHSLEEESSRATILGFLQSESDDEATLSGAVRIVLVSADFSTELTTAVLWLNRHDLDLTCIRLRPYKLNGEVLIDVTQIIPLPEAANYEVRVRAQEQEKRKVVGERQQIFRKFWSQFIEASKSKTPLFANRNPAADAWLNAGIGRTGFELNTRLTQHQSQVECYIRIAGSPEKNTAAFEGLLARKKEIEAKFGGPLEWHPLEGYLGSLIFVKVPGGWKSPEAEWPELQATLLDILVRFDGAMRKPIQELQL